MLKELKKDKKVFVAMSGGVDSSVAALLLKKQGYDVVGVFMKFWADMKSISGANENRCCSLEARRDAMRVCAKLNIPFLTWDFQKEFKKAVVNNFISGYKKGITPNPCVVCNKEIKFGLFFEKALKMGADYIATGHYVRLRKLKIENWKLEIARDRVKDQSYFLWNLTQNQLKHCLFPIGDYLKSEVRQIAKKAGLPVALKKESQEVCFVCDRDLAGFLKRHIYAKKGPIIESKTRKKIGEHQGVQFYTIGQRVPVGGTGPYFVAEKKLKKNQLLVVKRSAQDFFHKEIILKNINWISGKLPKSPKILVRTRYRQPLAAATLITADNKQISADKNPRQSAFKSASIRVLFGSGQKAVAPGQSVVFYSKNGELLGGGVII